MPTKTVRVDLTRWVIIAVCLCAGSFPALGYGAEPAKAGAIVEPTQPVKEKLAGDYKWNSPDEKKLYENALWNKIATTRLEGFGLAKNLVEKKTRDATSRRGHLSEEAGRYHLSLRHMARREKGASTVKIDSMDKLKARFAPVESEAEAASFVAVTRFDLKVSPSDVLEGHTLKAEDGYLVQAVAKNSFGCRAHIPTGIIFKVSKSGDIKHIAGVEEPEAKGPVLCTD